MRSESLWHALALAVCAGQKPSRNVWIGCMVALAGCLCIAADASAVDADEAAAFGLGEQPTAGWFAVPLGLWWNRSVGCDWHNLRRSLCPCPRHPHPCLAAGDAAILSSAFFFSLATVRLGTYARAIPAVELAAAKSLVLGGALRWGDGCEGLCAVGAGDCRSAASGPLLARQPAPLPDTRLAYRPTAAPTTPLQASPWARLAWRRRLWPLRERRFPTCGPATPTRWPGPS